MKPSTRSTIARATNNNLNNKRVQITRVNNSSSNNGIKSSSSGRKNMCKYINSNGNQCRNKIHVETRYCTFHLRDDTSSCNSDKTNTGELCKLQKAKGKSRCFHHFKFHQDDPQELYLVDSIDEPSIDAQEKDQQKDNQLGTNDNETTMDQDVVTEEFGIKNLNENGNGSSENSNKNKIDNNNNSSNDSGSKKEDNCLISSSSNKNNSNSTHQTIEITDHAEKEVKSNTINNDILLNGATLINQ